jgi:RNA polymerase sigma-70 factor (ECF subfamily)
MKQPLEADRYTELIRRVRAGEQQAAEELVRLYEPEIRLEVRGWLRLRDPRLRRVFDSVDVCQSVLASFFMRAALGEYDLERPAQLVGLLAGIARNKLADQVKYHQRERRDVRRVLPVAPAEADVRSAETPSEQVAGRELLVELRKRLSDEERELAERRAQGMDWSAIAAELGGTPEGRRKQLGRAIDRVERELGLTGDG